LLPSKKKKTDIVHLTPVELENYKYRTTENEKWSERRRQWKDSTRSRLNQVESKPKLERGSVEKKRELSGLLTWLREGRGGEGGGEQIKRTKMDPYDIQAR